MNRLPEETEFLRRNSVSRAQVFDRPRVVTEAELVEKLAPYIVGYPWALDTIGDLWRMGAPDPSPRLPGTPVRRILNPGQFAAWWKDVAERAGVEMAPGKVIK